MAIVISLVGRPGSGKSKIARCIKGYDLNLEERCLPANWAVEHISDYHFLLEMFRKEQAALEQGQVLSKRQFAPGDPKLGGFSVIDFSVLKQAMEIVKERILEKIQNPQTVILVEFARKNYMEAFEQLEWKNLVNAYFLYFDVEFDICTHRIHKRAACSIRTDDDNFVTNEIMEDYYKYDDLSVLKKCFEDRLKIITNNGELRETWSSVKSAVQTWCLPEQPVTGFVRSFFVPEMSEVIATTQRDEVLFSGNICLS